MQALRAGRIATADEKKIKRLLDEVAMMLRDMPMENPPPKSARSIYQKITELTGNHDPYRKIKDQSTEEALSLYPDLKRRVSNSEDSLLTAIRLAIAGNVIDFGANWNFDLDGKITEICVKDFAIFDYDQFKDCLHNANEILYIGDNAGECVFDRILIEEMKKPVLYAVRATPIINDATYEDAAAAGIDRVATIISSGADGPGAILETCNSEFIDIFKKAELIISKGQGNYEALSGEKGRIFFLLVAKCRVIASHIGVKVGDIILKGPQ